MSNARMEKQHAVAPTYTGISLFSGAGIGDVGFRASGIEFITLTEKEENRAAIAKVNFPEALVLVEDLESGFRAVAQKTKELLHNREAELFFIACTAPCQGMSKSGQGTLLSNIRKELRPHLDPRNRLILPALEIIKDLQPQFVVFENVCEMRNTVIEDRENRVRPILDIVTDALTPEYVGEAYDVEFADYGIPQRRKRLITVYTRHHNAVEYFRGGGRLIPDETHSRRPSSGKLPWVSVAEALRGFPKLDAETPETAAHLEFPFHRVPVLDKKKYEWVRHTPPGKSAFDNQCINPKCKYQKNQVHEAKRNDDGINQASKDTPLFCKQCNSLLPRPFVVGKDGKPRIMSGYTSAYKRMDPNLPCPAITRNFSFPCSDHKIHPFENRVLSFAEAFKIQTLNEFEYRWGPLQMERGKILDQAPDTLIRLVLGESIPPTFTRMLGTHLMEIVRGMKRAPVRENQLQLFAAV